MIVRNYASVLLIAIGCAAGSFLVTQALQPPEPDKAVGGAAGAPCGMASCGTAGCCKSLVGWLGLSAEESEQVARLAAPFGEERAKMEAALFSEREKLADLFDSDEASDEEILEQVERVIEADSALERRVAAHLVALRPHLTSEQRARLYKACANGVRAAGGCRWRHRDVGKSAGAKAGEPCGATQRAGQPGEKTVEPVRGCGSAGAGSAGG